MVRAGASTAGSVLERTGEEGVKGESEDVALIKVGLPWFDCLGAEQRCPCSEIELKTGRPEILSQHPAQINERMKRLVELKKRDTR